MSSESFTSSPQSGLDYRTIFNALPGNSHLLLNDAPNFTILASTSDILKLSGSTKEDLLGRGIFEVFPSNPYDKSDEGENSLRTSITHVITYKEPHQLPILRYDIKDETGQFVERYWKIENRPVFSPEGEVAYIIHTTEDITDQVNAKNKALEMEGIEKAYDLFMQAPVAVCIVSGEEHMVELANEQMLQLLGRTKEMVGKPLAQTLTEAKEQGLINVLHQVYATGKPYNAPQFKAEILINGEREKRYFDLVFQPYYKDQHNKKPGGIFCTAYNITQQVLSQKQIEESEHRFRTLIEEASVATCLYIGKELIIQYANDITIGYWGKDQSVIGKPLAEAIPELKGQPFLSYLESVYATGEPYVGIEEKAFLEVNGELKRFYFNFTYKALRDKEGNIYGIHQMAVDVTEQVVAKQQLEESAQELQLAIDAADLGTFRLDLLTNQATNSEKVNEWFGYTVQGYSREEGFNPIHPEDRGRVDEIIIGTLQSEANSRHDVTYRVVHPKTGVVRHLRSFGKAMFNEEGKPYVIIGIIQDVTSQILYHQQLKESEALLQQRVLERTLELEKLNEELKRSNKNLEEFAYAASHDMKEPIRKIHFFADRLKERLTQKMEEEDRRYFERLEAGTRRMSTLIDDLLLYSHVSRGASQMEEVDLNQMLSFVMDDLELHIEEKGASVQVGSLPTVQGRPRQLQQVFENLIGNALKYSKGEGTPLVRITSRLIQGSDTGVFSIAINKDNLYHLIEVSDNGIGFEQEDAERIFNVFTRLHGNKEYRGTGVGLSIVQKIIENHNGHIWAESKLGEGSTFKILLPAE